MANIDGTKLLIKIGGNVVTALTSNNMSNEVDMIETTSKDSDGHKTFIAGEDTGTFDIEALNDPSGTQNEEDIIDALLAKVPVTVYWGGIEVGDVYWTASALIQSVTCNGPKNEVASYSATLQRTGAITKATVAS